MSANKHCFVLDDDPIIARILAKTLSFKVHAFTNSKELFAPRPGKALEPSAIFVDIMLNDEENGLHAIPRMKSKWPHAVIIVLSSSSPETSIESALSSGADDFICKPLVPGEIKGRLTARIQKHLFMLSHNDLRPYHLDEDVYIDWSQGCLKNRKAPEKDTYLSPKEQKFLRFLLENKQEVLARSKIIEHCWPQLKVSNNSVDKLISTVRAKLKQVQAPFVIKSLYAQGLKLEHIGAQPSQTGGSG